MMLPITEFQEKLVLILVQYVGAALVVALAGYVISKSLERFKAREALASEFAKQRVKIIADCWSEMYKWEVILNTFVQRTAELQVQYSGAPDKFNAALISDLTPIEAKSKEQFAMVQTKVEENWFWLGETLYTQLQNYNNLLVNYSTAFVDGYDLSRFKSLESQIKNSKGNIAKTWREMSNSI